MSPRMTPTERRAAFSLAGVYGLRMLGLFLMLPVLAVGARSLTGGDDVAAVGLALGIYGLTQAVLQLPFGLASDRYGRKPVIILGLLMFVAGSVWCAVAPSVDQLVWGRALQGAGAVSAAVSAYLADLTRDEVRTRAMAIVGASIGLSFALSLVLAPPIYGWAGLSGLFWLTAVLGGLACVMVLRLPTPPALTAAASSEAAAPLGEQIRSLLADPQLLRLNLGIFSMMTLQAAMFIAIPTGLDRLGLRLEEHWMVYLPLLLLAFAAVIPLILMGERRGRLRPLFLGGIVLLGLAMGALLLAAMPSAGWATWLVAVWLFMVGFNLMEALLPSWVSRVAPAASRGLALGLYNTFMSLGLFAGGALGGTLLRAQGLAGVFWAGILLSLAWLLVSRGLLEIGPRKPRASPPSDPHLSEAGPSPLADGEAGLPRVG